MAKNDWGFTQYPLIPGHEIVGEVTEIGSKVEKVKVGDKVGVGCLVGSCRQCDQCTSDLENYCPKVIWTYGSVYTDGTLAHGGYSNLMVVDEHFIVLWPENFPLDIGSPLLCAGITTYSPLRYFGLDKPGMNIGVVGLGGLGHVAVKFAKAFGTKVTVISTSINKKKEAIEKLGADSFLVSRDPEEMKVRGIRIPSFFFFFFIIIIFFFLNILLRHETKLISTIVSVQVAAGTLDGIIDTVSATHPLLALISLLKPHGKMVLVGAPAQPLELPVFPLISGRKIIAGSGVGGMKETQEMIDFAAKHNILPDVEIIPIDYINTAMDRLAKSDVKYRFVIDIAKSLKAE
ncbi:geraniol dehydrogenase [Olea europaea subsp. europaea]|uniref:Geraniol dehydrogenase n=1 Tax=Olea europaea subsp. europaea TaxID=158383 RepID=A0A8S0SZ25_OLEEU|nr:geraniol dehydrogenase [Olea europaea subsp. europaea]